MPWASLVRCWPSPLVNINKSCSGSGLVWARDKLDINRGGSGKLTRKGDMHGKVADRTVRRQIHDDASTVFARVNSLSVISYARQIF